MRSGAEPTDAVGFTVALDRRPLLHLVPVALAGDRFRRARVAGVRAWHRWWPPWPASVLPQSSTAVEDPIRRDRQLVGARALRLAGVCVVVPGLVAYGAYRGSLSGQGVEEPAGQADTPVGRYDEWCTIVNQDKPNDWSAEACTIEPPNGDSDGTVLVLGDMSANSAVSEVIEAAHARNLAVAQWSRAGCPLLGSHARVPSDAEAWQEEALDRLVERLGPTAVVIANRADQVHHPNRVGRPLGQGSRPGRPPVSAPTIPKPL